MLEIKTTGFADYLDDSANIRQLIIGGPGVGKTRYSSFWPKPILIDCEGNRGSLADRAMPYARVRSSKDMLDVLEYLKSLERLPRPQRRHLTAVVDTADSFQRIVKDEWVQQTKAQAFSGFDAWGYLDTKMQMLFTRLLNLDMNVIVLVHHKDKVHKDGDSTTREYGLQLQGNISDQIFNDFGLVGWMGTYWESANVPGGKVQKRGLTFQPTPEKPFLKDTFNITPPWMPVEFSDADYQQFMDAFMARADLESMPAGGEVIGEVPDARPTGTGEGTTQPVNPPAEGGPLPPRPPAAPAEVPLEKKLKGELEEIAKGLGLVVRGNMLKSELIELIRAMQEAPTKGEEILDALATQRGVASPSDDASAGTAPASTSEPAAAPSESPSEPSTPAPSTTSTTPPGSSPSNDPWAPPSEPLDVAGVAAALGAEVISETPADAPAKQEAAAPSTPVDKPSAPVGPSVCADCHNDLAPDWADAVKKNAVRLSFVKFRRYLCAACYQAATS